MKELPEHLRAARHYAARHPVSVYNLLRLAQGKQPREGLSVKLRRLWCLVVGHDLVRDIWRNKDGPSDCELHVGCRRCPHVYVVPPPSLSRKEHL